MALEITELFKAKLKELKPCYLEKNLVTQYISKLEEFQKQKDLKGAEAGNPKIKEEWEKILRGIYSLEDTIESLSLKTTRQWHKQLFIGPRLNKKLGNLIGKAISQPVQLSTPNNLDGGHDQSPNIEIQPSCPADTQQVPTQETSSDPHDVTQVHSSGKISSDSSGYGEQIPTNSEATVPASEDHKLVVETDTPSTKKPEDLKPSPTVGQTYSDAQLRPGKSLSRKGSHPGFPLGGEILADSHDVTQVINELAHPLLDQITLHLLLLRADISCSGKTILLWTIYNAEAVKQHFHFRAWINVTIVSKKEDILKGIIKQVAQDEKEETLPSLQDRLRNVLVRKRYLIVLCGDRADILWDYLKSAFPYSLNGSKVIVAIPHTDGSEPMGKAMNGTPRENLVKSSVYLEDSSFTKAKAIIDELTESVLNPQRPSFLISVVGVVDSGKTTLLWAMYNAEDVKLHFECRAWIHVREGSKGEDILKGILEQVEGVKTEGTIEVLRKKLRDFLANKRCLVVLYDVWKDEIWEAVKLSLPTKSNGSRVIRAVHEVEIAFKGMEEIAPDAKRWFVKPSNSDIMDEEASDIVGLKDKIRELGQLALSSYNVHHRISVLGVTGSGKTTLVRAFYNSIAAKQHFDCRAWIKVPENFDEREILLDLSRQLRKAKENQSLSLKQLGLFLKWKRYLIVFDDVRSPDIWTKLKKTLPNLSDGSTLICSTRNTYLAYHMNPSSVVLALRPLDDNESWELFSTRMKDHKDITSEQKKMILRRCGGLPLTILMLGGLLSKKDKKEWPQVIEGTSKIGQKKRETTDKKHLNSSQSDLQTSEKNTEIQPVSPSGKDTEIQPVSPSGKDTEIQPEIQPVSPSGKDSTNESASSEIKQKEEQETQSKETEESKGIDGDSSTSGEDVIDDVLSNTVAMSYRDLSSPSKWCLLYLGLFPPEKEIPIRRLSQLWCAEGLVIASSGENSSREQSAKVCFEELLNGNLIEIGKKGLDGSPKTCRVINKLHDELFPNAMKAGFFHKDSNSDTLGPSTIRRLAAYSEKNPEPKSIRHLRSYISFCKKRGDAPTSGVNELLKNVMKAGFPTLVVLDLEGVYKPLLPQTLGEQTKLKYLGLRRTLLDSIPESVGDLPHLETLDIKDTYITTLPGTLWESRELQHLYMSETDFDVDVSISQQSADYSSSELQTLWGLMIRRKIPKENWLGRWVKLRKLKLTCHKDSIQAVASWIKNLKELETLKLRSINESNEPAQLELEGIGKLEKLSRLYLLGKFPETFHVTKLPEKLESLTLSLSMISYDPMSDLGKLQELKVLKLLAGSFTGKTMTCDRNWFPKLEVLKLWMLEELENWTVEDNAMPELKEVEIRCCKKLNNVQGPQKLTKLKELILTNMESSFIEKVKQEVGSEKVRTQDLKFAKWDVVENPVEE